MNTNELETIKAAILAKHAQLKAIAAELNELIETVESLRDNADNAADFCEESAANLGYAVEELTEKEDKAPALSPYLTKLVAA